MQCPPRPGPGIKGHESEGLCGGAVDDFPNIETHAQAELLQFVHQRDIDAAENVFEQLHHLGGARGADRNDLRNDLRVHAGGGASAWRIYSADDFGNLRQAELLVAGIFALGRKGQIEIGSDVLGASVRRSGTASRPFRESAARVPRWCPDTWCFRER